MQILNLLDANEAELQRQLQICNACRYCEGYCAVFPAMTRRLEFGKADIHYLANLCHNCGDCLHACQYSPPHEFAVNVPQAMAKVRGETYFEYAWPQMLGALYKRNGLTIAIALAVGLAVFLILASVMAGDIWNRPSTGNFYSVFPHGLMVTMFLPVFSWSVIALTIGLYRFWVNISPGQPTFLATSEAAKNVATLKYLDGGHGQGCNETDDAFSLWRRRFHHLTFYGFLLCFASTCVATIYHYAFAVHAPYSLTSIPVLLGTAGGVGLLIGPVGLFWMNYRRHIMHGDPQQKVMDRGFIALLFLTSLSGLALMIWRDTNAMALLLCLHLGVVMALFLTLPYGKFAHGMFRSVALLKYSIEKRQPNKLQLGAD